VIARLLHALFPARFAPANYLTRLVRIRTGMKVQAGPFAGMRYVDGSVGSAYLPKLLGIYERELNECIEQACALDFPLIINIGAGEGYYAVGMALRNPRAQLLAFEAEEAGQCAGKTLAQLNGVASRVEIRGVCGLQDLSSALSTGERCLIICDAEGHEEVLLNVDVVPALARAHLLVEMHEFVQRGITNEIVARFTSTHRVRHIWQEPRSRGDFPYRGLGTLLVSARYLDWAVSEWRPERMSWLWMEPKPTTNGSMKQPLANAVEVGQQ
jgi:hypothetical protein